MSAIPPNIADLPPEILFSIAEKLSLQDAARLAQSSRKFYEIIETQAKMIIQSIENNSYMSEKEIEECENKENPSFLGTLFNIYTKLEYTNRAISSRRIIEDPLKEIVKKACITEKDRKKARSRQLNFYTYQKQPQKLRTLLNEAEKLMERYQECLPEPEHIQRLRTEATFFVRTMPTTLPELPEPEEIQETDEPMPQERNENTGCCQVM